MLYLCWLMTAVTIGAEPDASVMRAVRTFHAAEEPVGCVALSADGKWLCAGTGVFSGLLQEPRPGNLIIWDLATGREVARRIAHKDGVSSVAFAPDSETLVSGSYDGSAVIWKSGSWQEIRRLTANEDATINCLAFSPDGSTLATGGEADMEAPVERFIVLWDTKNGARLKDLVGHSDGVTTLCFSPTGHQLLSGSWDQTAILWNPKTGAIRRTFASEQKPTDSRALQFATAVAFSPDGRLAAVAFGDFSPLNRGVVQIWDLQSGGMKTTLDMGTASSECIAFLPDQRHLATGYLDGSVVLWNIANGKKTVTVQAHEGKVCDLVITSEGSIMATAGSDGTVKLWNIATSS